jgi:two-component system response regulator HupR/HoxA
VDYFLTKTAETTNKPKKGLMGRAIEKLYDYAWPGNVRELQNEIERLCVLSGDEQKLDTKFYLQRF